MQISKETASNMHTSVLRIESISMTSLRFAEEFFFPFRIKRFGAYIWKLSAESQTRGHPQCRVFGCGPGPR